MTARKFVEDGLVNSEGGKLLAFIDTVEEAGMRWNVGTHRDGTYVLTILADRVEAGMRGAPSA